VFWHAEAFGESLSLFGSSASGETLKRVVDNVAGDGLAALTSVA
jgi:hypothetical protein